MIVRTNTQSFNKEMNNIVQYAIGFLDGVQKGKKILLNKGGLDIEGKLSLDDNAYKDAELVNVIERN